MQETELKRHLSAILAADVAGYSKLMANDERATVFALDTARVVFRTQIESHQGRVVDMVGDAVLAQFDTAVGAVAAAMAIQAEINASAAAAPPERRMQFRIGIHLGDVIQKSDGTLYGDGVNIAARLESLADYGGITVSSMVQEVVRNRLEANFTEQGEFEVKNIPYPVRAFRVKVEGSRPSEAKPKTAGDGNIDSILDQREQLDKLLKQKFKRRLTVMLTGLQDPASSTEAASEMATLEMIKRYNEVVTRAVNDQEGTVVKAVGDSTLSYFDTAQKALRAAVMIQRGLDELNMSRTAGALLLVRVGLHTGECFLEKNDIFGDVVNAAGLIETAAYPGEILLSEPTFLELDDKSETYCRHHVEVSLKARNESINCHKAFWDPAEAEKDRQHSSVAPVEESKAKSQDSSWKKWLLIAVPLLIVLAISFYAMNSGKLDRESRSVTHSLPGR